MILVGEVVKTDAGVVFGEMYHNYLLTASFTTFPALLTVTRA